MRTINYVVAIQESVERLLSLEKKQKQPRLRDRVRFIRLLKQGRALTQPQAGQLVGLGRRQSQALWKRYTAGGLEALLSSGHKGSWCKLSSQQLARLLQRLDGDDIATQGQLLAWLKAETGIRYTQPGVSALLARLKVKLKTGRPVNVRKDEAGEQAFKKTSPS